MVREVTRQNLMLFYFLYFILAALVSVSIILVPKTFLDSQAKTYELKNIIYTERFHNSLSFKDYFTGRVYTNFLNNKGFSEQKAKELFSFENVKDTAFKISFGKQQLILNEEYYDIAKPLVPVRYKSFVDARPVTMPDKKYFPEVLKVERVYKYG